MFERLPPIVIRADAHSSCGLGFGSGHVMRCLALAQVRRSAGGNVVFVMARGVEQMSDRLKKENVNISRINELPASLNDALHTADIARKEGAKWVILDGYEFTSDYQKTLKDEGLKLLVVDDNRDYDHYYADVILNSNIYANDKLYPRECRELYTRLLLGWDYHLLRREFTKVIPSSSSPEIATRLLVTLGGSDPHNVTLKVLEGLSLLDIPGIEVKVVVGDINPHYAKLRDYCDSRELNVELLRGVENMAEIMSWADCAVTAAGETCYELIYMQTPFLSMIVAENQIAFADRSHQLGICRSLGWYDKLSIERIADELQEFIYNTKERRRQKDKQEIMRGSSFDGAWLVNLEKGDICDRRT